jgi:hypothetical protein
VDGAALAFAGQHSAARGIGAGHRFLPPKIQGASS